LIRTLPRAADMTGAERSDMRVLPLRGQLTYIDSQKSRWRAPLYAGSPFLISRGRLTQIVQDRLGSADTLDLANVCLGEQPSAWRLTAMDR
jgi:hypothetical protein